MKQMLLFLLVFLMGVVAAFWVYVWQHQTASQQLVSMLPDPQASAGFTQTAFSLENAPVKSVRGEITAMSGDIWWESRVATEPSKLLNPVTLQQGEKIIASESGQLSVAFSDAAQVTLFAPAEVAIVQTLPVNFVFSQSKGTSEYLVNGPIPLSVRSLRLLTTVPQGKIQLNVNDEQHTVRLSVLEGSATVAYNDPEIVSQIVQVEMGDSFYFNSDERIGKLQ